MKLIYFALLITAIMACQNQSPEQPVSPLSIQWSLDSINAAFETESFVTFQIKNNSNEALVPGDWSLHYNHLGGRPDNNKLEGTFTYENPAGDYIIIKPTSEFGPIEAGATKNLSYIIDGHTDKMSETPKGVFAVINGEPTDVLPTKILGMNAGTLAAINPTTQATRYEEFRQLSQVPIDELQPFFPSPSSVSLQDGHLELSRKIQVALPNSASNIFDIIKTHQAWLKCDFTESAEKDANIILELDSNGKSDSEDYSLSISDQIRIRSASLKGLFYGLQSTLQLLYTNVTEDGFKIPYMKVEDKPRFGYRGMHLDVSRNFHSTQQVKKIIDMMAFFKLNTFHFHITDDEGWRLEIPGLPELTTVGSSRGYTMDEKDQLYPAYGSGPNPKKSYGSGFYTIDEFIDILRYANDRYVAVIPEIDVPGHSRAAIKAMRVRYDSFMAKGNEAEANEFLLDDENDESEYSSAQGYSDNVVCVCQDGAYNFMEKVLGEVIGLYKKAGVELNILHVGGDEIPSGSWEKSPICNQFIQNDAELNNTADLQTYFFNKMKKYLADRDIKMAGWEEIMLQRDNEGHNTTAIDETQIDGQTIPYVWNAVWGWGREDMIYKLANAGSPVILSNSAAFYFDMAYDRDPNEGGLSWSGFSGTKEAYGMDPLDIFKTARLDREGNPLDPEHVKNMERITEEGKENFMGIQAQLWSETINGEEWLDYLIYPKMFGFAERAWSPEGKWMQYDNPEDVDHEFQKEWNIFANSIGQKGLPMLDKMYEGIGYRRPKVGVGPNGDEAVEYPGYEVEEFNDDMKGKN